VEKAGLPGNEFPGRPHTFGYINSTEIPSIRDSGFFEGQMCYQGFRQAPGTQETVLG